MGKINFRGNHFNREFLNFILINILSFQEMLKNARQADTGVKLEVNERFSHFSYLVISRKRSSVETSCLVNKLILNFTF